MARLRVHPRRNPTLARLCILPPLGLLFLLLKHELEHLFLLFLVEVCIILFRFGEDELLHMCLHDLDPIVLELYLWQVVLL